MGNHENNPGDKYLPLNYDLLFFEVLKRVATKPHMLFSLMEQKMLLQCNLPGLSAS